MRGKSILWIIVCLAALVPSAPASATSYPWLSQGGSGPCRQVGFPGVSSLACDQIGPYYRSQRTVMNEVRNPPSYLAPQHTTSGLYCIGANVTGTGFGQWTVQGNRDLLSLTGFRPSEPYSAYQVESNGSACQGEGTTSGHLITGNASNTYCREPSAPCNVQSFYSLAGEGNALRPWAGSFGRHASLNLYALSTVKRVNLQSSTSGQPSPGAAGFLCPWLRDSTTGNILEACAIRWRVNDGFPPTSYEDRTEPLNGLCIWSPPNNPAGVRFDATFDPIAPDKKFLTSRAGWDTTISYPNNVNSPSTRFNYFAISADDLRRIISHGTACGGSGAYSQNPADYALIGVELGIEGGGKGASGAGGVLTIGERANALTAFTTVDSLYDGGRLGVNEALVSANGRYCLCMQSDGNLVIWDGPNPIWSSGTWGQPGAELFLQGDGNLVLWRNGVAIWNTAVYSGGERVLSMQDDGNLALYANGVARWSSIFGGARLAKVTRAARSLRPPTRASARTRSIGWWRRWAARSHAPGRVRAAQLLQG